MTDFWTSICENGHVVVERDATLSPDALQASLLEFDAHWRLELAFEPPPLDLAVAAWGASLIHRACQFLVYRDIEGKVIDAELSAPVPKEPSPGVCYSADLAFRVLPDLINQARGLATDDPLVTALTRLACAWPLSSVGVTGLDNLMIEPFIANRSLRQLYADRIIQRRDRSRLSDPRVVVAVREAIGGYPELAPSFRDALGAQ